MLVSEGLDTVRGLKFFRAIGGGIEFGESAETALRREFQEELGCQLQRVELLGVLENIFEYEGRSGHEVVHVFAVQSAALSSVPLDAELRVLDEGSLVRWVPVENLRGGQRPLFPAGSLELFARHDAER